MNNYFAMFARPRIVYGVDGKDIPRGFFVRVWILESETLICVNNELFRQNPEAYLEYRSIEDSQGWTFIRTENQTALYNLIVDRIKSHSTSGWVLQWIGSIVL